MPAYRANQSGTGFVDFGRILGSNQGAAAGMADRLAGDINQRGAGATGALRSYQNDFTQAVNMGRLGAEYSGPASFQDYDSGRLGQIRTDTADAQRRAQLGNSNAGRSALLQQSVTGPYGGGMARWDAALAGAGGGGRFEAANALYGSLLKGLGVAAEAGDAQVKDARAAGQYMPPRVTPMPTGSAAAPQHTYTQGANLFDARQQGGWSKPNRRLGRYERGL